MPSVSFVENFYDDDKSDVDDFQPLPRKKTRSSRSWVEREKFDASEAAENAVAERGIWEKCTSSTNLFLKLKSHLNTVNTNHQNFSRTENLYYLNEIFGLKKVYYSVKNKKIMAICITL